MNVKQELEVLNHNISLLIDIQLGGCKQCVSYCYLMDYKGYGCNVDNSYLENAETWKCERYRYDIKKEK